MLDLISRLRYEIAQYRKGLPSIASLGITERCSLRCKMCRFWIDGNHDAENELETDQIRGMIDELASDLGVRRIRLVGGEPFVREDAVEIIRHAKEVGMHVNVVTDGFEISRDLADQIVASGLDTIRFSLDGIGEVHDKVRGKTGSYLKASDSIRYIREAKKSRNVSRPEVQIFSVITSINYDQALPLWNESRTTFAPSRYLFGNAVETTPKIVEASLWNGKQLLDGHYIPIGRSLKLDAGQQAVFDSHVRKISGRQDPKAPMRLLRSMTRLFSNTGICPESYAIHIDPAGHVTFCSVCMNYSYGKYPESTMKDIWFSRRHAEFMKTVNSGGFLPVCSEVCGQTTRFYVGAPRQLARNLLMRAIRSPLISGKTESFRFETPDAEIRPRSEVMARIASCRAGLPPEG